MRKNANKSLNKKHSKIITVIISLFAFTLLVKGASLQPEITSNNDKIIELDAHIEYEQQRAKEIDNLKEDVNSDEYIEKIAREKLGMIKNDEIVFIDVTSENNNK